jgi:putative nucleotidyltransferase with HDIG domain
MKNNKLTELRERAKDIKLLYVEDEQSLREIMHTYLSKFFPSLDVAKDGQEGLELFNKNKYDIIITDILMPKLSGLEMATLIKQENENQNIVIVSAYSDTKDFIESIKLGIDGYILKPIDFGQLNKMLFKLVEKIDIFKENIKYQNNLQELVEIKTNDIKSLEESKIQNYKETIYALVQMIEKRDPYTGGHSHRVASYAKMIAHTLNLDEIICENIYQAGILHDIGKIAIPDNVLLKPSRLGDLEYTIIQEHVQIGVDMLSEIPLFKGLTEYIKYHHERYDGSGYPYGIVGDNIPFESQILAVSDAFDAMTTNRIYKGRKSVDEALEEIKGLSNIHFRNDVVDGALGALKDVIIDKQITQLPSTNIEKERFSYFYKDQVTQSFNANYLDLVLIKNSYNVEYKFLNIIGIHNLNIINEKEGWEGGSQYLIDVYNKLEELYKDFNIFRIFGDDYVILSKNKLEINKDILEKFICKEGISLEIEIYDIKEKQIFSFHDLEVLK